MDIDREKVEQTVLAFTLFDFLQGQIWVESLEEPRLASHEFLA